MTHCHPRLAFLLALAWLAASPALAATFQVDTAADAIDAAPGDGFCRTGARQCSLRAAVQEANALAGADTLVLPAGSFTLAIAGRGEELAATGDLDVLADLAVAGAGEGATTIDGAGLDRVFDHRAGAGASTLRLIGLTISGGDAGSGSASLGGCLANRTGRRLELERVSVRGCRAERAGAGIHNAGIFDGREVSIVGNGDPESSLRGGGLANTGPDAQAFLRDCELRGNAGEVGGAVYTSAEFVVPNTSEMRLERCSLVENSARQGGAAVAIDSRTVVSLLDSTVSTNTGGSGGALFDDGGGRFLIRNSTITANHTGNIGGGISEVHFSADFIRLSNSILAGNTAEFLGPDCHFRIRSEGATLLGQTTGCELTGAALDQVGADPLLGPLEHLAPRIWVHRPLPGSPAIDAGVTDLCTLTDQLGNSRPLDGNGDGRPGCDLGAFESGAAIFASGFESGDTAEWSAAVP